MTTIDAYLGVLIHLCVVGGSNRTVNDLFDRTIGDEFVRGCFTKTEFVAIISFIR